MTERGRPEQRQAFLSGAVKHVLRHGASGLSLRPLAAALGTSDRMLLYSFGSREHLLETVLEPGLRLYVEILGQAAAQVAPFPAAARRVAHRWLDWAQDRVDVPVAERQDAAAALLATVDGLLILHLAVGSGVADRAARRLLDQP